VNQLNAFSSIITDIYDCAVDPTLWPDTLGRINQQMKGAYLAVNLFDKATQTGRHAYHSVWDADWLERLNAYVFEIPGMSQQLFGAIDTPNSSLSQVSEAELRASRFFKEWAAPQGLLDGGSIKFVDTVSTIGILSFVVPDNRPPVTAEEHAHIQFLSPHIRRAMMIGDLIDAKDIELCSYRAAMDRLDFPLILSDARGKIHFANQAASALLDSGDVVRDQRGKLVVADLARKPALDDALARAHRGDRDIGLYGIGIPLSRDFERPTVGYVLPLNQSDARHLTGGASAAVFFSTGAGGMPVVEAVLSTLYGLTPTEVRVAREISGGDTTRAIGKRLNMSENTVKTHVRHIFEKTGITRQTELVRLLADLSPSGKLAS
jgi:DNA-binding CsgD family transcriptional regulator